ncbi:MAG: ABC transporter permease [Actinobacteria bacterium HGW-Actinobacteria-4]|nr:MAG: ABC transporter permease [Actinobacteria bacterium HGW-Actinobacteria-4]
MTAHVDTDVDPQAPPAQATWQSKLARAGLRALPHVGRWAAAIAGALLIFSILVSFKGANPIDVFGDMWTSTFSRSRSIGEIFIRMAPLALAALAVVVPARAGMINVGGEGQVIVGAVAAAGVGLATDQVLPGGVVLLLMAIAAILAGALWAGIAALLRLVFNVNEAVTTLLLNFVSLDLLLFLIYQPWRESPTQQPATRQLATEAQLPTLAATGVHVGIVVAVIAAVVLALALGRTRWGFRLAVVGGNPEAARRAGMPVTVLLLSALLVGGALAGLAGMIEFAGVETKLRPGFGTQIGYVGFLASWLARHKPVPVLIAAFTLAALAVGADSLQLDSGLPAATINILTALLLMAVLGWTAFRKKAA